MRHYIGDITQWKVQKKMMDAEFVQELRNYDEEAMDAPTVARLLAYLKEHPEMTPDAARRCRLTSG